MNTNTQKITPFLWFNNQAEEAMNFYTGLFNDARIVSINRYPEGFDEGPMAGMGGKVLTAVFELAGLQFMALDGGPIFQFTPAVSFFVNCETEAEVDKLWDELSNGGAVAMPLQAYPFSQKFGWVVDKYGLSWQLNLAGSPQNITPFLMFVGSEGQAETAVNDYIALFENAAISHLTHFEAGEPGIEGTVRQAAFTLHGRPFMAMDGGPAHNFTFTEAISFQVSCETQEEVDHFWYALSAHPEAEQCGWLKDKYGVSWQIIPTALPKLLTDPDPEKSRRVTEAMLQMKKIEIEGLERAHGGK